MFRRHPSDLAAALERAANERAAALSRYVHALARAGLPARVWWLSPLWRLRWRARRAELELQRLEDLARSRGG